MQCELVLMWDLTLSDHVWLKQFNDPQFAHFLDLIIKKKISRWYRTGDRLQIFKGLGMMLLYRDSLI